MIEQTSIPLSDTFVNSLRNIQDTGNELLIPELMNQSVAVEGMLSGYYYESRGKVHGLQLEKDSIVIEDSLRGHIKLHYSIHYFMGCQDITYDDKGTMRIDFEINVEEKIIQLTGENIREREPDIF